MMSLFSLIELVCWASPFQSAQFAQCLFSFEGVVVLPSASHNLPRPRAEGPEVPLTQVSKDMVHGP